jgi:hypothetical protein
MSRYREKSSQFYFSDIFGVSEEVLEEYGAFNISLITDLPLFIDPFLLFYSDRSQYQKLHNQIIQYLRFLKTNSEAGNVSRGLLKAWYCFGEVKQNWLGFCEQGNVGRGLGFDFAYALDQNLVHVFSNFGKEKITRGSHLEKLCLIKSGVGKDMISDFTTNLIKDYLLRYTEKFALKYISSKLRKKFAVSRVKFSYQTERWMSGCYELPVCGEDFVILTPKDILTKDDTWISHNDMNKRFFEIPDAIDNEQLRAQINNYLYKVIPQKRKPTKEDFMKAINRALGKYPVLIDYYIKMKEDAGGDAITDSTMKVLNSQQLYIKQYGQLSSLLYKHTAFYKIPGNTKKETRQKIEFFKDVIENKGGHRIFYVRGVPIRKETDVHILFRLTWHHTTSDVSREVDNGRGDVDFKISRGAADKTLVEFKLAGNPQLKRNLLKQVEIYKKASDAETGFKVILFFSKEEQKRVEKILQDLGLQNDPNIFLIDARRDNKPSASKA